MKPSQNGFFGHQALIFLWVLLSLAGCQSNRFLYEKPTLPTHVAGASDVQIIALQKSLSGHGIRVITVGQDYLISIPSKLLFATQSPQLRWESYGLLNEVVCYLQQFRKINTTISAYSSRYVSPQRERALTRARASAVAKYLWSQEIDTRFIFTQGMGSDKPIGAFKQYGDGSPVSRIEITFRRAVA